MKIIRRILKNGDEPMPNGDAKNPSSMTNAATTVPVPSAPLASVQDQSKSTPTAIVDTKTAPVMDSASESGNGSAAEKVAQNDMVKSSEPPDILNVVPDAVVPDAVEPDTKDSSGHLTPDPADPIMLLTESPTAPFVPVPDKDLGTGGLARTDDLMYMGYSAGTRQLNPVELYTNSAPPGKFIVYGVNSDVGLVRNNNQDACFTMVAENLSVETTPEFGLFVVADGMGGHHDGEKASALTTRTIARYLIGNFYGKLLNDSDDERPVVSEVLTDAVHKANEDITQFVPDGGTTVTALAIINGFAYLAHVGDSRAYLITDDGIEQITRDHSLVQRLIELDQITPEEATTHPQRNVLYRALGQNDMVEVDAMTKRLPANARVLLCSDGLWNLVPDNRLLTIINSARSPQEACDKLVQAANASGGTDNITAILVQLPG